ncbi:MAG TPA: hypothetical protein VFW40_11770 [Capsulimonadaceae bacterium]|nr:hypothetical protein [Capsulimonadaceae bacterium]
MSNAAHAILPLGAPVRRRKSVAGQSVFVALAVLFLLAFLGALFITIIARNLAHTSRTTQTLNADYYAQAGLNYANQMLETSPQGADWRPPLQFQLVVNGPNPPISKFLTNFNTQQNRAYTAAVSAFNLQNIDPRDPDEPWLLEGFSRFNVGTGRFLIRLSYVYDGTGFPNQAVGTSGTEKYIRIESVGRFGNVDPNDPTTFVNQPPTRLRAEMVAYKPVGIVDYSRFITNKDHRTDTVNLGVPSVNTGPGLAGNTYGATFTTAPFSATSPLASFNFATTLVTPNVVDFDTTPPAIRPYPILQSYGSAGGYAGFTGTGGTGFGGGSFRANCDVRLYGLNVAYLNPAIGDSWEIAGNLLFDRYNSAPAGATTSAQVAADQEAQLEVYTQPVGAGAATLNPLFPSTDATRYTTDGGFVRDGNNGSDPQGFPRGIQFLDPPSLDTTDPSSGLTRYRALTKLSTGAVNVGSPGTIYASNSSDIQTESQNLASGFTLRDEWLDRTGSAPAGQGNVKNWNADFYSPPGVIIRFGPIPNPSPTPTTPYLMLNNGEPAWGITLTRSDQDASGNPVFWPQVGGAAGTSQTIYIVYAPTAATVQGGETPAPPVAPDPGYPYFFMNAENAPNATITAGQTLIDPDNDITIFAEGNVRVSGMVSDPSTNNNNAAFQHVTIVTNGIGYIDGSILKGGPGYGAANNGVPTFNSASSAAVLAESYICVNTTQFLAGPTNFNLSTNITPNSAAPPFTLGFSQGSTLTEPVILTPAFDFGTAQAVAQQELYISQFSPNDANPELGQAQFTGTDLAGNPFTATSTGLLSAFHNAAYGGSNVGQTWSTQTTIPIASANPGFTVAGAGAFPQPYQPYQMTFSIPSTTTGWNLEHAGIFPSNARIEAILYAQNDSFFVIPGPWFNSNTTDTIYALPGTGSSTQGSTPRASDTDPSFPRFPMNGQPVDMQISVFGTVSENLPADIGDQAAWELKWGWIPTFHGSMYTGSASGAEVAPLRDPDYTAGIPQVGLNFSYDPTDGFDYVPGANAAQLQYVRLDQFGRPLPVTPNLPVSPDLLYSGQSPNTSLMP